MRNNNLFVYNNNYSKWSHVKSRLLHGDFSLCPHPLISVIMPCYKRFDTFQIALESVLNQDCNFAYEVVVVDNNVEDNSLIQKYIQQIDKPNVFYYRNDKNIGMTANWNRGIELSRADDVTFCHDDDMLLPNCLSRLMELRKQYSKELILSRRHYINDKGDYIRYTNYPREFLKHHVPVVERDHYRFTMYDWFVEGLGNGVGGLFHRECLLKIGGYNEGFYPLLDVALHCYYTKAYGCICNMVPTWAYRISEVCTTNGLLEEFKVKDDLIRSCMIQEIPLPRKYLISVKDARNRIRAMQREVEFNHKELTEGDISRNDSLIVSKYFRWHYYKQIRINWKNIKQHLFC